MSHPKPMPRLSVDLPYRRHPEMCQACGVEAAAVELQRWLEHNERDQPQPILVTLCAPCSEKLIDPHPRLYRQLGQWEPWPGAMPLCCDCRFRSGLKCVSPELKANGGEGLRLTYPRPRVAFLDGSFGSRQLVEYRGPVTACSGREEKTNG